MGIKERDGGFKEGGNSRRGVAFNQSGEKVQISERGYNCQMVGISCYGSKQMSILEEITGVRRREKVNLILRGNTETYWV